jgi:peptide/nickel transport system substrate-binding protein
MEMPPLDQPAIRQALQHAIDRQGLLNTVFGGAGTVANNTLISPAFKQWNNAAIEVPKFDIQLARKVLADAGYSWDTDGRLRFPSRL